MKKLFKIGMVMLLALTLAGCGGSKDTDSSSENSTTDDLLSGNHHAEIDVKDYGGAISMARSQDYDSASSQFFIVHQTASSLDGQYAVFGYVYEGMDVVDQIATSVPVTDDNGTVEAQNQPVINSIKIID